MSVPKVSNTLDGYRYEWPEGISIEATRIKQHTDGRVTGEIKIQKSGEDKNKHLHQAQFNFSSTSSRKTLSKTLLERYSSIDWDAVLEQLCVYTIERLREGDPVTEVWIDDNEISIPPYLIRPYVLKGVPTIIYGEKGVSKSTVALYLYLCLLLPWYDNPLGLDIDSKKSIKTLILDWEQEKNIVEYYARRLRKGHKLPPFSLYHLHCDTRLADITQKIQREIYNNDYQCLILDSLGAACQGDLLKSETSLEFFSALRKLKTKDGNSITSIIIAQTAKNTEGKEKNIFGSVYFTYYSRSIAEVCKAETSSENSIDVGLFHRWFNYGKLEKPLGFTIVYQDDLGIRFDPRSIDMAQFMEKMSGNQKIIEALRQGKKSTDEIQDLTGIKDNSLRVSLKRLKDKGIVIKLDDNHWGLKSHE